MKLYALLAGLLFLPALLSAQTTEKMGKMYTYFDNPLVIDTNSIILPIRYGGEVANVGKMIVENGELANIIIYNPIKDTYQRVFDSNTLVRIVEIPKRRDRFANEFDTLKKTPPYPTPKGILYTVRNNDFDGNKYIDGTDPSTLYASDREGKNLRTLTDPNEHLVSIDFFAKQKFALLTMQRDANGDKNFDHTDKDYYYVKLDLVTLTLGNKIEIK